METKIILENETMPMYKSMTHPQLEYWPQKRVTEIGNIKKQAAKSTSAWGSYQSRMRIYRLSVLKTGVERNIQNNVRQLQDDER